MTSLQYLARRLLASLSALLSTLPAVALETAFFLFVMLAFVSQNTSAAPVVAYTSPKPNGPVLDTPLNQRLHPHRKAGFCHAQVSPMPGIRLRMVLGVGAHTRKDCGMAGSMCLSPPPPVAPRQPTGVPKSQPGATMHHTPVASASARAPIQTVPSTSEAQAFALLQATSDATMAKLYLSKGDIPAARRKAVQLLKALQSLEVAA